MLAHRSFMEYIYIILFNFNITKCIQMYDYQHIVEAHLGKLLHTFELFDLHSMGSCNYLNKYY